MRLKIAVSVVRFRPWAPHPKSPPVPECPNSSQLSNYDSALAGFRWHFPSQSVPPKSHSILPAEWVSERVARNAIGYRRRVGGSRQKCGIEPLIVSSDGGGAPVTS